MTEDKENQFTITLPDEHAEFIREWGKAVDCDPAELASDGLVQWIEARGSNSSPAQDND